MFLPFSLRDETLSREADFDLSLETAAQKFLPSPSVAIMILFLQPDEVSAQDHEP